MDEAVTVHDQGAPVAIETESVVLGTLLQGYVKPATGDIFGREAHRRIYAAAKRIRTRGGRVGWETLIDELEAAGELEDVGGSHYVSLLFDRADVVGHGDRLQELQERARRRQLYQLGQWIQKAAGDSERQLAELAADARERFDHVEREAQRGRGLELLTGEELFAAPVESARWRVPEILPHGRQGTVYGVPGVAKSMFLRILAGGVATGAPNVLGQYQADPGPVLWVTSEEDVDELRRGIAMTAEGGGYDLEELKANLHALPLRAAEFTLQHARDRAWLEARVAEVKPALLVLDSLASLSGVDVKDDQVVLPLMRWGARLATAHGTCVVWIAHDRKAKPEGNGTADIDDLFGNRQVSAQLDFAWRLLRSGGDRALRCAKMRGAAEPDGDITLELVVDPDRLFALRVRPGHMSRNAETVEAIRKHLQGHPGETMSGLRDTVAQQLNQRVAEVHDVAKTLLAQGHIKNDGNAYRFSLRWAESDSCPDVSEEPGHESGENVSRSRPPYRGAEGTAGHAGSSPSAGHDFECLNPECSEEVGRRGVPCSGCYGNGWREGHPGGPDGG